MTRVAAVVFDLDGVLIESEPIKTAAFKEIFAQHPEHADEMMRFHAAYPSLPRRRKFERLAELLGRRDDAALVDALVMSFSERVRVALERAPLVPGALALLDDLGPAMPLYVASVTPQEDLDRLLERLGLATRFRRAFGDPPVRKADALREVIHEVGAPAAAVILVGDAPADLLAAREVGAAFIGRDSGIAFPPGTPPLHRDLFGVGAELRDLCEAISPP